MNTDSPPMRRQYLPSDGIPEPIAKDSEREALHRLRHRLAAVETLAAALADPDAYPGRGQRRDGATTCLQLIGQTLSAALPDVLALRFVLTVPFTRDALQQRLQTIPASADHRAIAIALVQPLAAAMPALTSAARTAGRTEELIVTALHILTLSGALAIDIRKARGPVKNADPEVAR